MTSSVARAKKTSAAAPAAPDKPDPRRASPIELRVRLACRAVPRGYVTTYGTIAKVLGTGPRAVGQFMRRNPYAPAAGYAPRLPGDPPAVPCHRVVASGGKVGGFMGHACSFRSKKLALLSAEGVEFRANGQLDREDKLVGLERMRELVKKLEEQEASEAGKEAGGAARAGGRKSAVERAEAAKKEAEEDGWSDSE